jgi:hypothetical protein
MQARALASSGLTPSGRTDGSRRAATALGGFPIVAAPGADPPLSLSITPGPKEKPNRRRREPSRRPLVRGTSSARLPPHPSASRDRLRRVCKRRGAVLAKRRGRPARAAGTERACSSDAEERSAGGSQLIDCNEARDEDRRMLRRETLHATSRTPGPRSPQASAHWPTSYAEVLYDLGL